MFQTYLVCEGNKLTMQLDGEFWEFGWTAGVIIASSVTMRLVSEPGKLFIRFGSRTYFLIFVTHLFSQL